jgi:hypothetical protein
MEACLWTEGIATPEQLETAVFPRLFALAEAAWSGVPPSAEGGDYPDFERRLGDKLKNLAERGVAFTPLEDCNPQGEARLEAIGRLYREMAESMSGGFKMPDPESLKRISAAYARGYNIPPEFLSARQTEGVKNER